MAIGSPASSAPLEEGDSNGLLEEHGRRDDTMHWCEGVDLLLEQVRSEAATLIPTSELCLSAYIDTRLSICAASAAS